MNNNIIYKKTSDYDSNSDLSTKSTTNSEINLDDSVISVNSDSDLDTNRNKNNQIYKNNIDLRNNINKELKNDLKNENQIINNIDININKNDNIVKNKTESEDYKNNYLNEFLNFIELNDYNIDCIENTNMLNEIIKFFIIQNNLDENEIKIFADLVYKNKSFLKKKIENKINNFNTQENFNTQDNNEIEENNNSTFFNKLANNDINTWIFIGIILISLIMIIMVILKNN
jgi:hypothetical protein